jgi:hypothetical protein
MDPFGSLLVLDCPLLVFVVRTFVRDLTGLRFRFPKNARQHFRKTLSKGAMRTETYGILELAVPSIASRKKISPYHQPAIGTRAATLVPAFSATPQCGIEAFDERMTVDRLAEEGDGTGRLCTLADSLFGKGGNEDDRYVRTAHGQRVLEFHSAHPGHLHVRNDARGIIQLGRGQELLRGTEHARLVAERPNEAAHCSPDGLVIVDD